MEEQQFELTCSTKAREIRVDINMKKLERVDGGEIETDKMDQTRGIQNVTNTSISNNNLGNSISGETTTINVSEPIEQEHDNLTWFTSRHVKSIDVENSTNQTHETRSTQLLERYVNKSQYS